MTKVMDYEEVNQIVVDFMNLVDSQLEVMGCDIKFIDDLWTDELVDKLADILHPYSTGTYRNYN